MRDLSARDSKSLDELLPWLYLKGVSTAQLRTVTVELYVGTFRRPANGAHRAQAEVEMVAAKQRAEQQAKMAQEASRANSRP